MAKMAHAPHWPSTSNKCSGPPSCIRAYVGIGILQCSAAKMRYFPTLTMKNSYLLTPVEASSHDPRYLGVNSNTRLQIARRERVRSRSD